ncbi:Leucine-, isoleucine-, valine-, threonine-, and alanine-binding protein [Paenibacillus sp. CECT 9249]|uniref:ABC transporter substrate-binding protein n=1 Tax=Paenibacillus sp. CECT 9249 TaxID=2845385 RepID=UPI001E4BD5E5|nr:ABC transporter substrate-binding protein [Paenibacillus sp. CECT 9249]CAH0120009.1 Leucine-, isoleucine-, valine-, threonine-, and alanine-binding protein [Paenibacillus sp. CECT 9249]
MNNKTYGIVVSVLLALTLVVSACGSPAGSAENGGSSQEDIVLSVAGPMSGDGAEYGKAFKEGAELAVSKYNDQGGYGGRKVRLVFGDDKNDPKEAANVAQKLASDSKVLAVIGHWSSSATYAGIPIYERNQIPMITPTASHPDLTKEETKWIFRSSTTQDMEGENLADYAVNILGKKKIAVLYINSDWGKSNADAFKRFAEQFGAEVAVFDSYPPGQNIDYTSALTKVKGVNPDLLYLGSLYNEGVLIIKQAKEMGIQADFMGASPFDSEGFLQAGSSVEGVYLDSLYFPEAEDERVQTFVKDFREMFNHEAGYFNALAHDATLAVLEGLDKGGPTREGIRNEMEKLNGFPVVTGEIKFDEKRDDVNKPYYNLVVKDGKFVLHK